MNLHTRKLHIDGETKRGRGMRRVQRQSIDVLSLSCFENQSVECDQSSGNTTKKTETDKLRLSAFILGRRLPQFGHVLITPIHQAI